jgi:hypothetical protein
MNGPWIVWITILWLVAITASIILIQYHMILGLYLASSLSVTGVVFYVFCKCKEYSQSHQPKAPRVVLPPAIPPNPPIVIMEGGKATHIGVRMDEPPRSVCLYVPIYVAHV